MTVVPEQSDCSTLSRPTDRDHDLCAQIIRGLRGNWSLSTLSKNRLPSMINGRLISDDVATAIGDFGVAWEKRQTGLSEALNSKDRDALVRRAFGKAFPDHTDDSPVDAAARTLCGEVNEALRQDIDAFANPRLFHFGCWLVRDQKLAFDLGPVCVVPRDDWLDDLERSGTIDAVIARRVRRAWSGTRPRKRRANNSSFRERSILDTIGGCPDVCTVRIANMAAGVGEEKALLTARLALTVISLLWERPSKAMEGFGLLVDGEHQNAWFMATRPGKSFIGSYGRARRLPGSTWTSDDLTVSWRDIDWLRIPAGKALSAFASGRLPHNRDAIDQAVFLAIWWMHEAIEAENALMATAKFGAVLDTLAGGRGKNHDIVNMLSDRLRISKEGAVTRRGQTLKQLVEKIYNRARSTTLHGLNDQFGYDWAETRDLAEILARDALAATFAWAHDNAADQLPAYS